MNDEVAVVCSRRDPASLNIFEQLSILIPWRSDHSYLSYGRWRLLVHDERQVELSGFDGRLAEIGLHPAVVVFASRHVSRSGMPWLGGHFTGKIDSHEKELSLAAPWSLKSFLCNLENFAPEGYDVSAEATHHGPVDMETPCFFAEIGSSETQWLDRNAALAVARSILGMAEKEWPVFLGFGGGHYVQRQTDLLLKSGIAFGHMFSKHELLNLNEGVVDQARRKSGATYAYIDRKSFKSSERSIIEGILKNLGLPILKGKEIREKFPLKNEE